MKFEIDNKSGRINDLSVDLSELENGLGSCTLEACEKILQAVKKTQEKLVNKQIQEIQDSKNTINFDIKDATITVEEEMTLDNIIKGMESFIKKQEEIEAKHQSDILPIRQEYEKKMKEYEKLCDNEKFRKPIFSPYMPMALGTIDRNYVFAMSLKLLLQEIQKKIEEDKKQYESYKQTRHNNENHPEKFYSTGPVEDIEK